MEMENKIKHLFNNDSSFDNHNKIIEDSKTVVESLQEYGRDESQTFEGGIEMYSIHLRRIETGHIVKKEETTEDQKQEIERKTREIEVIQSDIEKYQQEILDIKTVSIPNIKDEIKQQKEEYSKLESQDPKDMTNTDEKFRPFTYLIYLIAAIGLTFFIYYFYTNLGYVLFDIPGTLPPEIAFNCNPSVFNSLEELLGKGGCLTGISTGPLLLPILFLTIAIVIHSQIEGIIKRKDNRIKGYLAITLFVFLVVILDLILAIKFEERLFNWEGKGGPFAEPFPTGLLDQIKYSYDEPAFLMILGFGFLAYIVWSFILHLVSTEFEKRDPSIVWRRKLRLIEKKKDSLIEEKKELDNDISILIPSKIRELISKTPPIRDSIQLIKIGGKTKLRKSLIEFTIGWNEYLKYKHNDQISSTKINEITNGLNNFIKASSTFKGTESISDNQLILPKN
jgi:hypothetical protein